VRNRWNCVRSALTAFVGLTALAACERSVTGVSDKEWPTPEEVGAKLSPGIHPVLFAAEEGGRSRVEVRFIRVGVPTRIASYQGELRLDTNRVSLVAATLPEGLVGAWHPVDSGRLRFAGASLDGLVDTGAVLVLEVDSAAPLEAGVFSLDVEEMVATDGFADLTPQLAVRAHPILVVRRAHAPRQ
jgi:hypothetical protein